MKPDREACLRRAAMRPNGAMLREAFAVIDALRAAISATVVPRRLPVIAMCNHCAWCATVEDDDDWCEHPDAAQNHATGRAVDATRPPPSWCPMRGAQ